MTETDPTNAWITLRDYLLKDVRKEPCFARPEASDTSAQPLPEAWISARDYYVHGVRKTRNQPEKDPAVTHLQPDPDEETHPPEAWMTVYDALADVFSILSGGAIAYKIEQMQKDNRHDCHSELISDEEEQHRNTILNEIRDGHFTGMDDIVSWYLDTFFRVFDADVPEPAVTPAP